MTLVSDLIAARALKTAEDHCDWCGGELGAGRTWVMANWRSEYLRVHPHCAHEVMAKNKSTLAKSNGAENG
jgi:hypothetical protein